MQVGSSGIRDIILPFRQDIQNFICIKKSTLPESSLELVSCKGIFKMKNLEVSPKYYQAVVLYAAQRSGPRDPIYGCTIISGAEWYQETRQSSILMQCPPS